MSLGPLMLDLEGTALGAAERERLSHPLVGGVVLFARNYESPRQLVELTGAIRVLREPALLIAVDHEGGRVQRFQQGFTRLPPMRALGDRWKSERKSAVALAEAVGCVAAAELRAHGVDFSFSPVLDIDFGSSSVIGDRAFSDRPEAIAELAGAYIAGLSSRGAAAVGKHFPGHGYARADSHVEVPVDDRDLLEIEATDLGIYRALIPRGLAGVMPAHVIYPKVDRRPAGFSPVWLKEILRGRLGFRGMIFSDDLAMEGASIVGGVLERAEAALEAGCDMLLLCNSPALAEQLLDRLRAPALPPARVEAMRGKPLATALVSDFRYAAAVAEVRALFA